MFLDFPDQARILFDRDNTLAIYLRGRAAWLAAMGARRFY